MVTETKIWQCDWCCYSWTGRSIPPGWIEAPVNTRDSSGLMIHRHLCDVCARSLGVIVRQPVAPETNRSLNVCKCGHTLNAHQPKGKSCDVPDCFCSKFELRQETAPAAHCLCGHPKLAHLDGAGCCNHVSGITRCNCQHYTT